jgi:hypothetical protein
LAPQQRPHRGESGAGAGPNLMASRVRSGEGAGRGGGKGGAHRRSQGASWPGNFGDRGEEINWGTQSTGVKEGGVLVPDPRGAAGKGVKGPPGRGEGGWRLPGLAGRGRGRAGRATGQEGKDQWAVPTGGIGIEVLEHGTGQGSGKHPGCAPAPGIPFPNTGWEGPGSPEGRSMSRRPQARGSHLPPTPCSPFGAASATFGIGMCAAHRDTAQDEPWGIAEG